MYHSILFFIDLLRFIIYCIEVMDSNPISRISDTILLPNKSNTPFPKRAQTEHYSLFFGVTPSTTLNSLRYFLSFFQFGNLSESIICSNRVHKYLKPSLAYRPTTLIAQGVHIHSPVIEQQCNRPVNCICRYH